MRRKQATISQIAKALDVSVATVSRALNNRDRVDSKTKQKVIQAARRMGYSPKMTATDKQIFGLLPAKSNLYDPYSTRVEFIDAITRELSNHSCKLLNLPSVADILEHGDFADALLNPRMKVLYCLFSGSTPEIWRSIHPYADYFIAVNAPKPLPAHVYEVRSNYEEGTQNATAMLIRKGHNKIAYFGLSTQHLVGQGRLQGYKAALEKAGMDFDERLVSFDNNAGTPNYTPLWHAIDKARATAIVAGSRRCTIAAYDMLKSVGLKIPEDVSLIGHEVPNLCERTSPPITCIKEPIRLLGSEAVRKAIALVEGKKHVSMTTTIPNELIFRDSVAEAG